MSVYIVTREIGYDGYPDVAIENIFDELDDAVEFADGAYADYKLKHPDEDSGDCTRRVNNQTYNGVSALSNRIEYLVGEEYYGILETGHAYWCVVEMPALHCRGERSDKSDGRSLKAKIPTGYILVEDRKDVDYPGVIVRFSEDGKHSTVDDIIAAVEYNYDDREIETAVYCREYDETASIISFETGCDKIGW